MPKKFQSFQKLSKINWGVTLEEGTFPGYDRLTLGAQLRIADATEVMAKNWNTLTDERNLYQRWWKEEQAKVKKLNNRNAALRGVIRRLKRT